MQAKGLFLVLASLPSDWIIYQTQLYEFSNNGRDAVMKAFKELIAAHYIFAVRKVNKSGQFKGWNYIVYPEKQIDGQPITENPLTENPKTDNQVLTNKETTNKEENKQILKHTQGASSFFSVDDKNTEQPAHQQPKKPKQPKRENGKPKATDTLAVRRKKFWAEIVAASHTVSTNQESAEAFRDHYTATAVDNPNLMRFEADRFWNTEKRLAKWMKLEKTNDYD